LRVACLPPSGVWFRLSYVCIEPAPPKALLTAVVLWLAWGCSAPPEGRRAVGLGTLGVALAIAALTAVRVRLDAYVHPDRCAQDASTRDHQILKTTKDPQYMGLSLS